MLDYILAHATKPALFAQGHQPFWDDEHISKGMLEAHLTPDWDAATYRISLVEQAVDWIAATWPADRYPCLIDLGCGPGLYAERFHRRGYKVTGMDFSARSIEYAKKSAARQEYAIDYIRQSYLELDVEAVYDLAVMISCDYGVLSREDRESLLRRVHRALKPGGVLLFDNLTPVRYAGKEESGKWYVERQSGYWSDAPYLCLESFYRFDEDNTFLDHYVIAEANRCRCFHVWQHASTREELREELERVGFAVDSFYSNVAGAPDFEETDTLCVVAKRNNLVGKNR